MAFQNNPLIPASGKTPHNVTKPLTSDSNKPYNQDCVICTITDQIEKDIVPAIRSSHNKVHAITKTKRSKIFE